MKTSSSLYKHHTNHVFETEEEHEHQTSAICNLSQDSTRQTARIRRLLQVWASHVRCPELCKTKSLGRYQILSTCRCPGTSIKSNRRRSALESDAYPNSEISRWLQTLISSWLAVFLKVSRYYSTKAATRVCLILRPPTNLADFELFSFPIPYHRRRRIPSQDAYRFTNPGLVL
jgi:hypothetical protein